MQTEAVIVFLLTSIVCVTTTHGAHLLMFSLCEGFLQINSKTKNNLEKMSKIYVKAIYPATKKANNTKQIKDVP